MSREINWSDHSREAAKLLSRGQTTEAIGMFREIADAHADNPHVHNNLAVALKTVGRHEEAIKACQTALAIDGGFSVARFNLARILREIGREEQALEALLSIVGSDLGDNDVLAELERGLLAMPFREPSAPGLEALRLLFQDRTRDLMRLVAPAARLLYSNPEFSMAMEAANAAYPDQRPLVSLEPGPDAEPLLKDMLTWTIVPVPDIEKWITVLRRQLLTYWGDGRAIETDIDLLWAIAAQCHITGHAQVTSSCERATLERLLGENEGVAETQVAIAAMYRPLAQIPGTQAAWENLNGRSRDSRRDSAKTVLFHREMEDRRIEQHLAARIPTLTPVRDRLSAAVRDQYEENPYPVWQSMPRRAAPVPLGPWLTNRFPGTIHDGLDVEHPKILVAGCGTGQHAIATAKRFAGSSVLAVDLSRQSLAYAMRKADQMKVENVEFARADILGLGEIGQRFDVIEATGVLHHMADPVAGWRVLRGLLKPLGLMRIGLYSAIARAPLGRFQRAIQDNLSADETSDLIRCRRAKILSASGTEFADFVLGISDFYSVSGCRDLLFHVQETQFTLPMVTANLERLDLRMLGFEALPEKTMAGFRSRFPEKGAETDLGKWETFERANTTAFLGMYQFWCQARA